MDPLNLVLRLERSHGVIGCNCHAKLAHFSLILILSSLEELPLQSLLIANIIVLKHHLVLLLRSRHHHGPRGSNFGQLVLIRQALTLRLLRAKQLLLFLGRNGLILRILTLTLNFIGHSLLLLQNHLLVLLLLNLVGLLRVLLR